MKAAIQHDDFQLRAQVVPLRKMGYTVLEICDQLGLHRPTDMKAVQAICDSRELLRYRKDGPTVAGPVKPGANRSQVKLA